MSRLKEALLVLESEIPNLCLREDSVSSRENALLEREQNVKTRETAVEIGEKQLQERATKINNREAAVRQVSDQLSQARAQLRAAEERDAMRDRKLTEARRELGELRAWKKKMENLLPAQAAVVTEQVEREDAILQAQMKVKAEEVNA